MCDTAIICLFSYLVYPGDLVPILWEINCSYNKLFKKVNKYAYIYIPEIKIFFLT